MVFEVRGRVGGHFHASRVSVTRSTWATPSSSKIKFPGPVAQLGEHLVCNQGVGSSSLPRSTNQFNNLPASAFSASASWCTFWCTSPSKTGAFPQARYYRSHSRSHQRHKVIYCHSGVADGCAKRTNGKLFVLRNGEIGPSAGLGHYHVASHLSGNSPPAFLEGADRFLAGNIGETRHLVRQKRGFQAGQSAKILLRLFGLQPRARRRWLP